ncbi:hypothetical protein, partial [Thermus sp.]|uniref:hypothetical protein n=1 Tax=Thermus sp. TaxID=275 RepID=UPI003D1444B2
MLPRLQLGGERTYGWGRVSVASVEEPAPSEPLFGRYAVRSNTWPPVLEAKQGAPLLAHALAADFNDGHRALAGIT